jgi:hypothetical protein
MAIITRNVMLEIDEIKSVIFVSKRFPTRLVVSRCDSFRLFVVNNNAHTVTPAFGCDSIIAVDLVPGTSPHR